MANYVLPASTIWCPDVTHPGTVRMLVWCWLIYEESIAYLLANCICVHISFMLIDTQFYSTGYCFDSEVSLILRHTTHIPQPVIATRSNFSFDWFFPLRASEMYTHVEFYTVISIAPFMCLSVPKNKCLSRARPRRCYRINSTRYSWSTVCCFLACS